jgi:hypothetical protein
MAWWMSRLHKWPPRMARPALIKPGPGIVPSRRRSDSGGLAGVTLLIPWAPQSHGPYLAICSHRFEDSNSSRNVGIDGKATGQRMSCPTSVRTWPDSTMAAMAILCQRPFPGSELVRLTRQRMSQGPYPNQLNAGNRCTDRRSRRLRPTVGAKVMRFNQPTGMRLYVVALTGAGQRTTPADGIPPVAAGPVHAAPSSLVAVLARGGSRARPALGAALGAALGLALARAA